MTTILPEADLALDAAIATAYSYLESFEVDSQEYHTTLTRISELYTLKFAAANIRMEAWQFDNKHQLEVDAAERQLDLDSRSFLARIDPNTALTVAGNLVIGLAVINYEQRGVVASKVFSFLAKL